MEPIQTSQNNRAVVLAGGGARGAYQIGVWRALREMEIPFSIVTGTSVGALNGAFMVQGDYEFAKSMWESINAGQVLDIPGFDESWQETPANSLHFFLSNILRQGGADPRPLEELLRQKLDEQKVLASPVRFAFLTVEYPGFAPCILDKEEIPPGSLVDYLMASASCFPAMKMRCIGDKRYIDGGYYDNMPVDLAIEMGAREIIAVDLDGVGVRRMGERPDGIPIHYIRSYWNLGNILGFEAKTARQNITLGYLDACKTLGDCQGQAYTFAPGELTKLEALGLGSLSKRLSPLLPEDSPRENHSLLLGAARQAILRCLANKRRRSPLSISPLAMAAELCAQTLGVSPLRRYTAAGFRHALFARWQRLQRREEPPASEQSISLWLSQAAQSLSEASKTAYCLRRMQEHLAGTLELSLLPVLAAAMPTEFISAFYLLSVLEEFPGQV